MNLKKSNVIPTLFLILKDNPEIEAELDEIKSPFQKIFNSRNKINKKNEDKAKKTLNKFIEDTFTLIHSFEIDINLIKDFILDLPNGKATGINGFSNEMLKNACNEYIVCLVKSLFELIIYYGIIPKKFNTSILKPLIKDISKSSSDPSNLRPLAVSDMISNLFEKILLF